MNLNAMQARLETRFEGDHARIARMRHFMGMLKSSVDGLIAIGVVVNVDIEGLPDQASPAPPNALESLETAIEHMMGGQHVPTGNNS